MLERRAKSNGMSSGAEESAIHRSAPAIELRESGGTMAEPIRTKDDDKPANRDTLIRLANSCNRAAARHSACRHQRSRRAGFLDDRADPAQAYRRLNSLRRAKAAGQPVRLSSTSHFTGCSAIASPSPTHPRFAACPLSSGSPRHSARKSAPVAICVVNPRAAIHKITTTIVAVSRTLRR